MIKKISLLVMSVFYVLAGINHFRKPESYYVLIPPYLPFPQLINIVSGMGEIIFGFLLLFPTTRKIGAYGIIALLIPFTLTHIYMLQMGGCMGDRACIPMWVLWLRLFPLQPLLILWAWWHRK